MPVWMKMIASMKDDYGNPAKLDVIRILSMEQYRNPKASMIVRTYYLEKPMEVTIELFKELERQGEKLSADPVTLAVAYQYPMFALTQEFIIRLSAKEPVEGVLEKMKNHVKFFWERVLISD